MNILLALNTIILNVVLTAETAQQTAGFDPVKKIVIALVIGLIVGLIYSLSLKSQLTSVYKNETAADYVRPNSFVLSDQKDLFMYSKTEKTPKPKQN